MGFLDTMKGWFGKAKETAGDVAEKAAPVAEKAWDTTKDVAEKAWETTKDVAGKAKDKVEGMRHHEEREETPAT